jgi:hypothetical protein
MLGLQTDVEILTSLHEWYERGRTVARQKQSRERREPLGQLTRDDPMGEVLRAGSHADLGQENGEIPDGGDGAGTVHDDHSTAF